MPDWLYYTHHQGLKEAAVLLKSVTSVLSLPEIVTSYSMRIYERLHARQLTQGRRREELIGACIYISCQGVNYPIKLRNLCQACQSDKKSIIRQKKFIKRFVETNERGITPEAYTSRYCYELGLIEEEKTKALKTLKQVKRVLVNKKPQSIAATSTYLAHRDLISIRQIARVSGLSTSHVYNCVKQARD